MPRYTVNVRYLANTGYTIKANSPEEAIEKYHAGEFGEADYDSPEEEWEVTAELQE